MRHARDLVLNLIGKGCSQAEAKRRVAKHLGVSEQTVNRAWRKRETLEELSAEEFLLQMFESVSSNNHGQIATGDPNVK
jgi:DNA invertase Pin-like site-specific DNA recombinase